MTVWLLLNCKDEPSQRRQGSILKPLRFPCRDEVERSNKRRLDSLSGTTWTYCSVDGGKLPLEQRTRILANFLAPETLVLKVHAQVCLNHF